MFRAGDKRARNPNLLAQCLKAGISVAAIHYRLSQHALKIECSVRCKGDAQSGPADLEFFQKHFGMKK